MVLALCRGFQHHYIWMILGDDCPTEDIGPCGLLLYTDVSSLPALSGLIKCLVQIDKIMCSVLEKP